MTFFQPKSNFFDYIFLFGNYGIIIFCALAVYLRIKHGISKFNTFNQTIHRQTTIVLFFEAIMPFFTLICPLLVYLVTNHLNIPLTLLDGITNIIAYFHPLMVALVKMTIIKCYREVLKEWFRLIFFQKHKVFFNQQNLQLFHSSKKLNIPLTNSRN